MKLALGLALLAGGIVLLIWGVTAADSMASQFSEFFTGNPTDKAMWLVFGGVLATIAGATLTALGAKSRAA